MGPLPAAAAWAFDVHVNAEFKPDIRDPSRLSFVNTTEMQGNCTNSAYRPRYQKEGGIVVPIQGDQAGRK